MAAVRARMTFLRPVLLFLLATSVQAAMLSGCPEGWSRRTPGPAWPGSDHAMLETMFSSLTAMLSARGSTSPTTASARIITDLGTKKSPLESGLIVGCGGRI